MLAVWQATIVDSHGDVVSNASVQVLIESSGALAALFADRDGETPISNPITADENGFVRFYAAGNSYRITATSGSFSRTWRHVPIGLLSELDVVPGAMIQYEQTDAEIAAYVTPTDLSYPPGFPQRFGGAPGGTDARVAIQSAINAAAEAATATDRGVVTLTAGEWWISLGTGNIGLEIPSNVELVFETGASLNLLPHNASTYQVLNVWSVSNVRIIDPVINGNKDENSAVSGEHGMGIDIRSADNIRLERPVISNCWGDGIYIGPLSAGGTPSTNVHIWKPRISACRRQGISITSVNGLWITDAVITDILGTDPQSGIDIEPNVAADVIRDVYIDGAKITGCTAGAGFLVQPGTAATGGFHVFAKNVSVNNCMWGFQSRGAYQAGYAPGAGVIMEDFKATNIASTGIYIRKHHSGSWPFRFIRPVIEDVNQGGFTSVDGAFICLFRTSDEDAAPYDYTIGNVHIEGASLSGTGTNYFEISGRSQGVNNISFIDPMLMAGDTATIQAFMDHVVKLGSTQNYVMTNRRRSFTPPSTIQTSAAAQTATNDSLEAILLWAARFRHLWGYGGSGLTIELQSGSTLTRQVLITDGPDLGWVTITAGGGATISVQRSAVTRTLTGMGTPVFGGRACIMPIIAASFTMDSSGSTTTNRHMYALRDGARGSVVGVTLTSNDGRGAWYDNGAEGLLRGATIVGSVSDIHITNGSIVRAGGTMGASNLTDNTPAADGLILR